jgi:hypothetical protein
MITLPRDLYAAAVKSQSPRPLSIAMERGGRNAVGVRLALRIYPTSWSINR